MRKKIVVGGVIVLVVGALLFVYGFFFPPRIALVDNTETIQDGMYRYYWIKIPFGIGLHTEYTTSDEVEFLVLDSHNFELFEAYIVCKEMHAYIGKSHSHTFHAPRDDRYYIVLVNIGFGTVSASVKISGDVRWARFVWLGGIGLSVIGLISLIVGLILKPKMADPLRLLDAKKLARYGVAS